MSKYLWTILYITPNTHTHTHTHTHIYIHIYIYIYIYVVTYTCRYKHVYVKSQKRQGKSIKKNNLWRHFLLWISWDKKNISDERHVLKNSTYCVKNEIVIFVVMFFFFFCLFFFLSFLTIQNGRPTASLIHLRKLCMVITRVFRIHFSSHRTYIHIYIYT